MISKNKLDQFNLIEHLYTDKRCTHFYSLKHMLLRKLLC